MDTPASVRGIGGRKLGALPRKPHAPSHGRHPAQQPVRPWKSKQKNAPPRSNCSRCVPKSDLNRLLRDPHTKQTQQNFRQQRLVRALRNGDHHVSAHGLCVGRAAQRISLYVCMTNGLFRGHSFRRYWASNARTWLGELNINTSMMDSPGICTGPNCWYVVMGGAKNFRSIPAYAKASRW